MHSTTYDCDSGHQITANVDWEVLNDILMGNCPFCEDPGVTIWLRGHTFTSDYYF